MKKLIVCGAFVLGALVMGGNVISAQACDGKCKKPTTTPAPEPAPEEPGM